jgi:hypothetical protein
MLLCVLFFSSRLLRFPVSSYTQQATFGCPALKKSHICNTNVTWQPSFLCYPVNTPRFTFFRANFLLFAQHSALVTQHFFFSPLFTDSTGNRMDFDGLPIAFDGHSIARHGHLTVMIRHPHGLTPLTTILALL